MSDRFNPPKSVLQENSIYRVQSLPAFREGSDLGDAYSPFIPASTTTRDHLVDSA